MQYKEVIAKGRKDLDRMLYGIEFEINRLKEENRKLRKEIDRLKEARNGEP